MEKMKKFGHYVSDKAKGMFVKKGSDQDKMRKMYECQDDQYEVLEGVSRSASVENVTKINSENNSSAIPQKFLDIREARLRDSEEHQLHET